MTRTFFPLLLASCAKTVSYTHLDVYKRQAQNKSLTRSKIGKAIQYALNLEKGLRVYLDDGLVPMINSLDERNIRPFTVSRKNFLFCASTKGADASASIFSLIRGLMI